MNRIEQGKISQENLVHFSCANCSKWWTIGDAPTDKLDWYCPWCGLKQIFKQPGN